MTERGRAKKIQRLEKRITVGMYNAHQWMLYVRNLKLQQLELTQDSILRLSMKIKLIQWSKRIEEHEGLLESLEKGLMNDVAYELGLEAVQETSS